MTTTKVESCRIYIYMERPQVIIESMKKTMQTHEQIFKQQVQELHRLYNLQKMLMRELKNEQSWRRNESSTVSQSFKTFFKREDPTEPSGSCSGESSRLVPIKVEDDHLEVELTLSIGRRCTRGIDKSRSHLQQQCNPQFLDFDRSNPVEETSSLSRVNTGKDEAYGEPTSQVLP